MTQIFTVTSRVNRNGNYLQSEQKTSNKFFVADQTFLQRKVRHFIFCILWDLLNCGVLYQFGTWWCTHILDALTTVSLSVRPILSWKYSFYKYNQASNRVSTMVVYFNYFKRSCVGVFLLRRCQARDHEDYIEDKYCSMYRVVVHESTGKKEQQIRYGITRRKAIWQEWDWFLRMFGEWCSSLKRYYIVVMMWVMIILKEIVDLKGLVHYLC